MDATLDPDLTAADALSFTTRMLWVLVGAALLSWSLEIVNSGWEYAWGGGTAVLLGGWGVATVVAGVAAPASLSRRLRDLCGWATMLVGVLGLVVWTLLSIRSGNGYGTDELAFNQYAASLVQHGINPYTHSMKPALTLFSVSEHGITHTLSGQVVTQVSYPALSFLVYVPFLALGWSNQLGIGVDLIGWALSILLMFAMLPRTMRPAALLIGLTGGYISLSNIGLTDLAFMPLLLVAAYRWDRFGRSRWSWIGPAALGLALAAKQTAWPILPFVLIALALDGWRPEGGGGTVDAESAVGGPVDAEPAVGGTVDAEPAVGGTGVGRRLVGGRAVDLRRAGRYLAIVVVAFAIPNVVFIVADPIAWWHGVWTPLVKDLVPGGQGAVAVSLLVHIGGGSLRAFTILGALTVLWLLVVYIGTYPLLRATTFILPSIAYFFAARSYAIYLVALIPPTLVAVLTARSEPAAAREWRRAFISPGWLYAAGILIVLWIAAGVDALSASPPMRLHILDVTELSGSGGEQQLTVSVTNRSDAAVRPRFSLQTASSVTNFWRVLHGPATLSRGQSATYTLIAPDAGAQEPLNQGIRLVAFTTKPASVSVSGRYQPSLWSIGFVPEYSDITARVGGTVVVGVQLLDRISSPLRIGGVPVTLSELQTPGASVATIGGAGAGASAVAKTNGDGVASFRLTATRAAEYPAQFSATLPSGGHWGYTFASASPLTLRIVGP